MLGTPEWTEQASCRGLDAQTIDEYFFNPGTVPATTLRMCAACPVIVQCRDWADQNREEYGTFAAESAAKRHRRWARTGVVVRRPGAA